MRHLISLVFAISSAACLRQTVYTCEVNTDCGANGVCDPGLKLCSVADGACPSGFRYSDTAGAQAGQCVGGGPPGDDGGVDMPPPPPDGDAPPPEDCPGDFQQLPGGSAHVYKFLSSADQWVAQATACKSASSRPTLAVPKTSAEQAAITMFVGAGPASYWIGIDDIDADGSFKDQTGAAATFDGVTVGNTKGVSPWAPNEPTDQNGSGAELCVEVSTVTNLWSDNKCNAGNVRRAAVCECAPP